MDCDTAAVIFDRTNCGLPLAGSTTPYVQGGPDDGLAPAGRQAVVVL